MVSEWRVGAADVGLLVSRIFDSSRDSSLVVVSPASDTHQPRINTAMLAERLAPGTELAVLESMVASERLSDTVDTQFQVYGGSVRVILAGAARTDHWRRHRLFRIYPGDDADHACREIVEYVEVHQKAGESKRIGAPAPATALSSAQAAALSDFKATLRRPASPASPIPKPRAPQPAPLIPQPVAARPVESAKAEVSAGITAGELKRILQSHTDTIAATVRRAIQDDLLALLDHDRDALARERSRADAAEEELDQLNRRIADQEQQRGYPAVYRDPERQLRWEVEYEWAIGTPEVERDGKVLTPYILGEGFLKSLDSDIVPRRKTIQIIVDIVSGRAWERRETHQFTETSKSGIQRARPDGAVAWRTYVKVGAHGAPRLIWWQLPDGTIELSHVGHHDDLLR